MNKKRADNFLKYIATLVKQNPNISFNCEKDCRLIYHELIKYDVKEEDKHVNIEKEGMFKRWQKEYEASIRTNVFVDPNWSYFCQFISTNRQVSNDYIKIYVPTGHKYLEKNAIMIFDFLEKNKISHVSKIGKEIRFDNIVIRVNNNQDARKIIDFLSNNKIIQQGLINPNPFAFTTNNIAMACDGNLSYNSIISSYIGLYIEYKKKTNNLDNISMDDWINFIKNYYEDKFIRKNNLDDIPKYFHIGNNDELEYSLPYQQLHFKHITELIIKSFQDSFSLDDLITHFNKCNNSELLKDEKQELTTKKEELNEKKLLFEAISYMSQKYQDREEAIQRINMYLETNNPCCITRDGGLREKIFNSNLRATINEELKEMNISFIEYFNKILRKDNKVDIDLLNNYFMITIDKYGKDIAITNLINYIQNGQENNITRADGLRDRIIKFNLRDSLIRYFKDNNYRPENLYNFFSNYIDNNLNIESQKTK